MELYLCLLFYDTATPEIITAFLTLSLHDALPIWRKGPAGPSREERMTSVRNRLERLDAASSAHDRQHYARESDVSVHEVPAAFGAHRMTRYVYGRKLDPIARASGAGLAAGFHLSSLTSMAPRSRSGARKNVVRGKR